MARHFPLARTAATGALALLLAACATMTQTTGGAAAQQSVTIEAAAGETGALLFTPTGDGPWPAVLLYPDVSGLRPVYAELGRKLADHGYVVLVPNPFYRSVALDGSAATAAPALPPSETFQRGQEWRALATDDAVMADARALVAWLDRQPGVDQTAKIGVVGYDIGGAHAFIAARAVPQRIGAVAAVHPTAIATARDTSPHLFVGQSRAAYLVEIAGPDDAREPEDRGDLVAAFTAAGLSATVDVVPAAHGYAVPDQPGHDPAAAAEFFADLLHLLEQKLR